MARVNIVNLGYRRVSGASEGKKTYSEKKRSFTIKYSISSIAEWK